MRQQQVPATGPLGAPSVAATSLPSATVEPPDVVNMRMKDYHRLVRSNYMAVEGPRVAVRSGGRVRAYLPFMILVLGLLIGAAVVLGKF